jgi:hypothetical protein
VEIKLANGGLLDQIAIIPKRLISLESPAASENSSTSSVHSSTSSGRLCTSDLREGMHLLPPTTHDQSPYPLRACSWSGLHTHDTPYSLRPVLPVITVHLPIPPGTLPQPLCKSDAPKPPVPITIPPYPIRCKLPQPLRTRSTPVLTTSYPPESKRPVRDAIPPDHLSAGLQDRKSTRLNSSHRSISRMPSSA